MIEVFFVTVCIVIGCSVPRICECVKDGQRPNPNEIDTEVSRSLVNLMTDCWSQLPARRPVAQGQRTINNKITKNVNKQ